MRQTHVREGALVCLAVRPKTGIQRRLRGRGIVDRENCWLATIVRDAAVPVATAAGTFGMATAFTPLIAFTGSART